MTKYRKLYFQLIEAATPEDKVRRVADTLLGLMSQAGRLDAPVDLTSIVEQLAIAPELVFAGIDTEGRLDHDQARDRFVVILRKRPSSKLAEHETPSLFESDDRRVRLTPTQRFTYAHEVAHRFFFVSDNNVWRRAAHVACRNVRSDLRPRAEARLIALEERLCDAVAGEVLIPRTLLTDALPRRWTEWTDEPLSYCAFSEDLRRLASAFSVSEDCLFVRLQRLSAERAINMPSGFCAMLVEVSRRKGDRAIGLKKARCIAAITPTTLDGQKVVPWYPGIPLGVISPDGLDALRALMGTWKGDAIPKSLPLDFALKPEKDSEVGRSRRKMLVGWGIGRGIYWNSPRALVWGMLRDPEAGRALVS
ncbi:MAG: ImmA/IrrE family metallo-endopeptidase [Planctomycetota bacterium]